MQLFQRQLKTETGRYSDCWQAEAFQKGSAWPGQAAQTICILGSSPEDLSSKSSRIRNPVLLIGSHDDRLIPRSALTELEGHLQNVSLQWVDGGHLGIVENPEDYFVEIEQFI